MWFEGIQDIIDSVEWELSQRPFGDHNINMEEFTMMNDINENVENTNPVDVPYIVYESSLARMERHIKRLWIAVIIAVIALAVSNLAWLYYESQFETISYAQEGEGINNVNLGEQGDLYGTESQNQKEENQ